MAKPILNFNFLRTSRVWFTQAMNDTFNFLVDRYQQDNILLTKASPFLQLTTILHELFQMSMFYVDDALNEQNIITAQRDVSIQGISRLSGHNPTRAQSAKGEIAIQFKAGVLNEIEGSFVNIKNGTVIKNKNNNLKYTLFLDSEQIVLSKTTREKFFAQIVQGEIITDTFTSDGTMLSSYSVKNKRNTFIDNQHVKVYVNDRQYKIYEFFYDIPKDAYGCVVRTGLTGGLDVYFGNEYFGRAPITGETIRVEYLETVGFAGNIYGNPSEIYWEWDEFVTDTLGNDIDPNVIFNTYSENSVIFGANPESRDFTKIIGGHGSTTNVLANSEKYIYYLNKLNLFSFVDAYNTFDDDYLDDDNITYLFLIPDLKRKLTNDTNYFTTQESNFLLETYEKNKLLATIEESGQKMMTAEVAIVDPIIKKYTINIILKVYKGYSIGGLRNQIINDFSDYFINIKRRDSIPASDLIAMLEAYEYIDSVKVQFISKENEEAMKNGFYYVNNFVGTEIVKEKVFLDTGENPLLGIDEFGDIKIGRNELPIIRGGFFDRNGQYYEETPIENKLSSLNIIIKEVIEKDLFIDIMNEKKKQLK